MGWIFKRKGKDVLDLTERYRKQQEKLKEMQENASESSGSTGAIGIFGMSNTTTTSTSTGDDVVDLSSSVDEKRKRLAKRLMDMTEKIEDLNNQIYHLQQRLEVLERKNGTGTSTGGFGIFD